MEGNEHLVFSAYEDISTIHCTINVKAFLTNLCRRYGIQLQHNPLVNYTKTCVKPAYDYNAQMCGERGM